MDFSNYIIVIPARIGSSRLPGKPLLKIAGIPMIVHVYNCAVAANLGCPILIATDSKLIESAIIKIGGLAIITKSDHVSGSDRIFEALQKFDPNEKYKKIIHLQGDLPNISGSLIRALAKVINNNSRDLATAVVSASEDEYNDPSIVKAVIAFASENPKPGDLGKSLYFSRACIPVGAKYIWHHIGIYAWQRQILKKFISLPESPLEKSEKLEQLRALEANINIYSIVTSEHPIGVDTEKDLEKAKKLYKNLL